MNLNLNLNFLLRLRWGAIVSACLGVASIVAVVNKDDSVATVLAINSVAWALLSRNDETTNRP
jgi:hypothetical protein